MYTLDDFCSGLNRLFYRCNIEQAETDIIVRRAYDSEENSPENNKNEVLCKFDTNLISSIIDAVNRKNIEGHALLDNHSFEIAVRSQVFLLIGTKSEHWVKTDTDQMGLRKKSLRKQFCNDFFLCGAS